jgi:hypothetical protein
MRDKVIRKPSVWILCAVVVGGLAYSTIGLSVPPAHAQSSVCEPDDCTLAQNTLAPQVCHSRGGVRTVFCPLSSTPPGNNEWEVICNDNFDVSFNCTNY